MLNFRLARPARLIDLERVAGLAYLDGATDGALRIGAMTRQATLERSHVVAARWPLLRDAVRHVGHIQTRRAGRSAARSRTPTRRPSCRSCSPRSTRASTCDP